MDEPTRPGRRWGRRDQPPHRCEHCGAVSEHPDDIADRYCARCHHFCDDVDYWDRLQQVPLF